MLYWSIASTLFTTRCTLWIVSDPSYKLRARMDGSSTCAAALYAFGGHHFVMDFSFLIYRSKSGEQLKLVWTHQIVAPLVAFRYPSSILNQVSKYFILFQAGFSICDDCIAWCGPAWTKPSGLSLTSSTNTKPASTASPSFMLVI